MKKVLSYDASYDVYAGVQVASIIRAVKLERENQTNFRIT
jgi:hypothetical protein